MSEKYDPNRFTIDEEEPQEAVQYDPSRFSIVEDENFSNVKSGGESTARTPGMFPPASGVDAGLMGLAKAVLTAFPDPSGKSSLAETLPEKDIEEGARSSARAAIEGGVGVATTGASAGLPILGRVAAQGGTNFLSSLFAENFDPSEAPLTRAGTSALWSMAGEGVVSSLSKSITSAGKAASETIPNPDAAVDDLLQGLLKGKSPRDIEKNIGGRLAAKIEGTLGGKFNPDIPKAARKHWGTFQKLAEGGPDKFNANFQSLSTEETAALKTFLNDGKGWENIQGAVLGDLLDQHNKAGGAGHLAEILNRNTGNYDRTKLATIFGSEGYSNLTQLAASMKKQGTTAGLNLQWARDNFHISIPAISVGMLMGPRMGAVAGVVALSPQVAAKLLTNTKFNKILKAGLSAPPGSELAARAMTQLSIMAAQAEKGEEPSPEKNVYQPRLTSQNPVPIANLFDNYQEGIK
jgi:hypothetical protein